MLTPPDIECSLPLPDCCRCSCCCVACSFILSAKVIPKPSVCALCCMIPVAAPAPSTLELGGRGGAEKACDDDAADDADPTEDEFDLGWAAGAEGAARAALPLAALSP